MSASRRQILAALASLPALGGLGLPARAAADDPRRLIVIVLRGGLDGLSAVPPHGDPRYREIRRSLALPAPGEEGGIVDLDGSFGLHPALAPLAPMYEAGQLLPIHAAGLPYQDRSHFEAQDVLESGADGPWRLDSGWLNRALAVRGGVGLSASASTPLLLRGAAPITAVSPELLPDAGAGWLRRMAVLYAHDDVLGPLLQEGLAARERTQAAAPGEPGRGREAARWFAETAGRLMAAPDGPRVAALEIGGWDSHAGQAGQLDRMLGRFAELLLALQGALGDAWSQTAILAATEFGRTAAPNGTRGTDHGVGSAALLLGGAVRGGRVAADWPGLGETDLLDGRDLRPTVDLRSVCKGLLRDQLGLDPAQIDREVFPDAAGLPTTDGLVT